VDLYAYTGLYRRTRMCGCVHGVYWRVSYTKPMATLIFNTHTPTPRFTVPEIRTCRRVYGIEKLKGSSDRQFFRTTKYRVQWRRFVTLVPRGQLTMNTAYGSNRYIFNMLHILYVHGQVASTSLEEFRADHLNRHGRVG